MTKIQEKISTRLKEVLEFFENNRGLERISFICHTHFDAHHTILLSISNRLHTVEDIDEKKRDRC